MVTIKVISIFLMVAVGFFASKAKWLPRESAKYLSKIVMNIAAPAVVITSIFNVSATFENLKSLGLIAILTIILMVFLNFLSIFLARVFHVKKEHRGIYRNFFMFTNNGFIGFPVCLAIFGKAGMFPLVVINIVTTIGLFIFGMHNLIKFNRDDGSAGIKERIKHLFSFPVVISLITIFAFGISIPIPDFLMDIFDMIGEMMAPLAMFVIGIQLTDSNLVKLTRNYKLLLMSVFRLAIIPVLVFTSLSFIQKYVFFFHSLFPALFIPVFTLSCLLPCGAVPASFAEEHTKEGTFAAEGVLLSTLLSIGTITIWSMFL